MTPASRLRAIKPERRTSPWEGYEHYCGYGVMSLPFSSGHMLGLRVFPINDFAPYRSVWHRDPDGNWSIYNDAPALETACPRWWGPALAHAALTNIALMWTEPNHLRVEMTEPKLTWTMTIEAPPLVRAMNAFNAAQPLWTWKPGPLLWMREWVSRRFLRMGDISLAITTPSGQEAIVMPQETYFITEAQATLEGQDLGKAVHLDETPAIGGVPLPTRPTFMVGQAHARIPDREEYERLRAQVSRSPTHAAPA